MVTEPYLERKVSVLAHLPFFFDDCDLHSNLSIYLTASLSPPPSPLSSLPHLTRSKISISFPFISITNVLSKRRPTRASCWVNPKSKSRLERCFRRAGSPPCCYDELIAFLLAMSTEPPSSFFDVISILNEDYGRISIKCGVPLSLSAEVERVRGMTRVRYFLVTSPFHCVSLPSIRLKI